MQRVEVALEDDLTGGPADETVTFGVDGRAYEIDLNARHAATFRNQLATFVERARLVHQRRSRTTTRTAASRERSREIRSWAEQHGLAVAEHGRLPANVVREYEVAHASQPSGRRAARRQTGAHGSAGKRSGNKSKAGGRSR